MLIYQHRLISDILLKCKNTVHLEVKSEVYMYMYLSIWCQLMMGKWIHTDTIDSFMLSILTRWVGLLCYMAIWRRKIQKMKKIRTEKGAALLLIWPLISKIFKNRVCIPATKQFTCPGSQTMELVTSEWP